ncbi:hypothetical protein HMPREF1553_02308 [Porphyromonas gingivalis F0568]|nr:hypothetical protein HMPREF1553_02308 [Porphyromonas gingivalis F0568]
MPSRNSRTEAKALLTGLPYAVLFEIVLAGAGTIPLAFTAEEVCYSQQQYGTQLPNR